MNTESRDKVHYGTIWVLGFGMLGISLLWSVYNTHVPIYLQAGRPGFSGGDGVRGFGLGATLTGFIMTLDNLAGLLILPYVGALSDRTRTRWGRRRPFILLGAPVAALAFAVIPLTLGTTLAWFMGAIIVTLLAMDLFRTPTIALMPDLTPPSQRSPANGIISVMGSIGGVLAFGVGGWLFRFSPAAPFLFAAAGMLAAALIVVATVREPARVEPEEEAPRLLASLSAVVKDRDRSALLLLAAVFCWFLSYSAFEVFFTSFAVSELGLDTGQATHLLGYAAVALLVGSLPAGLIAGRVGRRRTLLAGTVLFMGLLAWGYSLHSVPVIRAMLVLAGFACALIIVNALPMVLDYAPPSREGTYTGLYYLASQLAAVVGPTLAGGVIALAANDYRALFLFAPATLVIAFTFMLAVRHREAAAHEPVASRA